MSVRVLSRGFTIVLSAVFCICALMNGFLWLNNYYFNITGSIPRGIYRISPAKRLQRNDLVLACLPEELSSLAFKQGYIFSGSCPGKYAPIGKFVCALAEDKVFFSAKGIWVNDELLPNTAPIQHLKQNNIEKDSITLSNDEIVLCAYKHNSYDGRYFGLGKTSWLRGRLESVWLFE